MDLRKIVKEKYEPTQEDIFRDKRTALVDGVYMRNHPIRKKMFKWIWAKYNMLPDIITDSLGKLYNIVEDLYLPDKNWKSLFDYTHDGSSMYSDYISQKYLNAGENNIPYEVSIVPKGGYIKSPYDNIDYINSVFKNPNGRYEVEIKENTTLSPLNSLYNVFFPRLNKSYDDNNRLEYTNISTTFNEKFDEISDIEDISSRSRLLNKTAKLFKENKIATLVARFHTDNDTLGNTYNKNEYIDSAKTRYGNSHGRNLLKKGRYSTDYTEYDLTNGYSNPYCRVWTYHNQYSKVKNLIRPFDADVESLNLLKQFRTENGGNYLSNNTVLNKNGFVNITPKNDGISKREVKKTMFSIENLAWKDVLKDNLTEEQRGPNGGRIMWFPPYDLSFQENVSVNWNENQFIGRGEPIYTYANTRRSGTLNFTMLIDHPSIINGRYGNNSVIYKDGEDYETDLLRFFAGCDFPDDINLEIGKDEITETNNYTLNERVTEKQILNNGIEESENEDETKTIKFYVFFPNNYSGHMNNINSSDSDWVDYISKGYGASFKENEKIGYEISNESGISTISEEDDLEEFTIKACVDDECKIENENSDRWFRYRVDKDLRQNGLRIDEESNYSSYIDDISFGLNCKNGGFTTLKEKVDTSFIAIYCALNDIKNEYTEEIDGKLKEIIENKDSVFNISVTGYATSQDNKNAQTLAIRRARSVSSWLRKYFTNIENYGVKQDVIKLSDMSTINSQEAKEARSALVTLKYNAPKIIRQEDNNIAAYNNINKTENYWYNNKIIKIRRKNAYGYSLIDEGLYFKDLEKEDNFLYNKIKDKIKYFNPAYHSITPEGFNSRLNFLHQCTRQGHTLEGIGDTKDTTTTAGNMAFGRAPFCVLRIGDFINTKILVKGFTITYENGGGMQWDMNPEGIGVQPMYAKINMQIEILGGQSLEAPITRLNNAVSFNYYANTGVYDTRADIASYDGNGGIKYDKIWVPNDEGILYETIRVEEKEYEDKNEGNGIVRNSIKNNLKFSNNPKPTKLPKI